MENKDEENQSSKRVSVTQSDDQVGLDFAIATVLQEQERSFSVLETIDSESEEYESEASYGNNNNNNDYEYLESLEDLGFLEGQESTEDEDEDMDDDDDDDDDDDEEDEIDPDDLTYEELIALGEIIGVEKRGLSQDEISSCLVPCKFKCLELKTGIDRCVICQVEYEEEEDVVALPNCEHPFHADCISKWLQIKKICPICSYEISSPSKK